MLLSWCFGVLGEEHWGYVLALRGGLLVEGVFDPRFNKTPYSRNSPTRLLVILVFLAMRLTKKSVHLKSSNTPQLVVNH